MNVRTVKIGVERHTASFHIRRNSWSYAAITGYAAAFYRSSTRPNEADTCGYCGEEFERTRVVDTLDVKIASDEDWEPRIAHLTNEHKFGECNQTKKFFRADHFRQHLKRAHAGMSGKWMMILENACIKDEPAPGPDYDPSEISNIIGLLNTAHLQ